MNLNAWIKLISQGYSADIVFLAYFIKRGEVIPNTPKVSALLSFMERKGIIQGDILTKLGEDLVGLLEGKEEIPIKQEVNYGDIYGKVQERILQLTGNKQVRVNIMGSKYSFLCNGTDFRAKLKKACLKYRLEDIGRVEKTLLNYIEKCHREKNWSPLLHYYILKDDQSRLATEYGNSEESQEEIKKDFEI